MVAPLGEQFELANEDVRIAEAITALRAIRPEDPTQAAELLDERAYEMKSPWALIRSSVSARVVMWQPVGWV